MFYNVVNGYDKVTYYYCCKKVLTDFLWMRSENDGQLQIAGDNAAHTVASDAAIAAASAGAELVESGRVHYALSHPVLGVRRYRVVVRRGK
jgi:hypothetical protein